MESCPFCAIVAGEHAQREEVVYADDDVAAFVCVPSATRGHVLVVPRAHVRDIWEIGEDTAARIMRVAHQLAAAMKEALGAEGLNLRQNSGERAGQDVFHFHLHLVPRYADDTVLEGCVWGRPPWQPPPGGRAARLEAARRIRAALPSVTAG